MHERKTTGFPLAARQPIPEPPDEEPRIGNPPHAKM
jgi:hypothetical protein